MYSENLSCRILNFFLTTMLFCLVFVFPVQALEISIPPTAITAGETTKIHLNIDKASNLAGVRLILSYNSTELSYAGALITPQTAQMMYVVNERKPGELIIVMAGAQGVSGDNFSILDLSFKAKQLKSKIMSQIVINDAQLMSGQFKDLPHTLKTYPVTIVPAD